MHLIIGGAYQGKLEYARERFGLTDEDISLCTDDREPDFTRPCLYHIELFVLFCLRKGRKPTEEINKWCKTHRGGVLICEDIFCGVVPTDKETRIWREAVGRFMSWAAEQSDGVVRIFCGLPQVLK